MIPKLTIDKESVASQWDDESARDYVSNLCSPIMLEDDLPLYKCDDSWVNLKVFNEAKSTCRISDFFKYGYCDTENALKKYLQTYKEDTENSYFVEVGTMSMDYEKYYKNGSYINKDGVNTEEDYYDYIDKHPEMETQQDIENKWITFAIYKIKE